MIHWTDGVPNGRRERGGRGVSECKREREREHSTVHRGLGEVEGEGGGRSE